ncbi:MAG: GNAT family N-acetyltransferase [Oscillospiraceae bacterium]|nr:GNAT family N-acetyltransferase [Oscillospiraceae bacterium]
MKLPIKTNRLLLREICSKDANNVYNLFSNPNVMRYLDLPHANIAQSQHYIDTLLKDYEHKPRLRWEFAVILAKTGEFAGIVELEVGFEPVVDSRAELQYLFLPEFCGKGYASEANKAVIKFGFEELRVNKITAGCLQCNLASERAMIRCGMTKEGDYKQHTKWDGEWVNRVEYAVLKDEYYVEKGKTL